MADQIPVEKVSVSPSEGPSFEEIMAHRVACFDACVAKPSPIPAIEAAPITIKYLGAEYPGVAGETTPWDVIMLAVEATEDKGLKKSLVARVDGETMWDNGRPFEASCEMEAFSFDTPEGLQVYRHSSAHVLGQALERTHQVTVSTGPDCKEGFYYDSKLPGGRTFSQDDYTPVQKEMAKINKEKQKFIRLAVTKEDALEMFKYNPFKVEILTEKVPEGGVCTVYRCGDFIDPCRGPHIGNTAQVKCVEVHKNSSAYFKADSSRDNLQRLYAISFPDKKGLKAWKSAIEEAMKRDHRLIGAKQELFFFNELSPGSAFWLPHGTIIYTRLLAFMREQYRLRGYKEVITPNIYDKKLWETSGHWAHYSDAVFQTKVEDVTNAVKPMNCPGHCVMFRHRPRSHRELPLRLADFGVLHRNELSGALSGLTRVRRFQQDDAHIFCTQAQIIDEIDGVLDFLSYVYGLFGFKFSLKLSTRPEKFLGEVAVWDDAEAQLKVALDRFGKDWSLNPGDGAFYGPKIDIEVEDCLGRQHQCATIQLDFQLPERFELEYRGDTERHAGDAALRPVMIHRAIFGSIERFTAILIEHIAGKWPFWLSPRQAIIVPLHKDFNDYAESLSLKLHDAGIEAATDLSSKTLKKKIRAAQMDQYNFILVVGKSEMEEGTVNVRTRENKQRGAISIEDLIAEFQQLKADYK